MKEHFFDVPIVSLDVLYKGEKGNRAPSGMCLTEDPLNPDNLGFRDCSLSPTSPDLDVPGLPVVAD